LWNWESVGKKVGEGLGPGPTTRVSKIGSGRPSKAFWLSSFGFPSKNSGAQGDFGKPDSSSIFQDVEFNWAIYHDLKMPQNFWGSVENRLSS